MFFREKKTRKTRVAQLVENRRDSEGKVRQRVVVSLGGCPVPDEHRKRVAAELSRRMAGYEQLLSEEPIIEYWVGRVIEHMEEAGSLPPAARREVPTWPTCAARSAICSTSTKPSCFTI
ncbi:hypothetical protein PDESU_01909 [Pontiella desulfatans]|uniref:Uncharacterized protein n=1 Tax=Pontiella desulfatans TaxID=2750659 RepID=A0A6C2U0F7_PONDE|nr:hypothetical protein [Pontiella desulfatans]VGO13353.1 hypothetical protein PDESU_01909 [Pontiella desulfatans]